MPILYINMRLSKLSVKCVRCVLRLYLCAYQFSFDGGQLVFELRQHDRVLVLVLPGHPPYLIGIHLQLQV